MSNMSYCRFQNTERDLQDCYDHMDDDLSEEEKQAKESLIQICSDIHHNFGDDAYVD